MSYTVTGTTISLTRGDTFRAQININLPDSSEPYIPVEGDVIRFAMKKSLSEADPILLLKNVPIDTMILTIEPEDTKSLSFGDYVYDIEITMANGDVCTFITNAKFKITSEVH